MRKIEIHYVNGESTRSELKESSFGQLRSWWLNPKAPKTYRVAGMNELLLHKDRIAYILEVGNKQ
jgi:hypothetical protein